jgi:hypothetical protein
MAPSARNAKSIRSSRVQALLLRFIRVRGPDRSGRLAINKL